MLLTDSEIMRLLHSGALTIDPAPRREDVQPVSVDLHVGARFLRFTEDQEIDTHQQPSMAEIVLNEGEGLCMPPGSFLLGATVERIRLPRDIAGILAGKSGTARLGLSVEIAGIVDPGYSGSLTVELSNHSGLPLWIYAGDLIAQIIFLRLAGPVAMTYGDPALRSKYQHSEGAVASRFYQNFSLR